MEEPRDGRAGGPATDPTDRQPDVSLVVVNYNGAGRLTECVASLLADAVPSRELWLVDNASTDRSLAEIDALARAHSLLHVHRSEVNRGYAGAVNAVLPRCRGRYVGVLNMDISAEPGWLAPLVDFLDGHAEVGAVCPMLALDDGDTVNALGQDIHVTALGFNRDLGRTRRDVDDDPFPVAGLQGAAFLVRRGLLEEMGGMEASGFLYHEDVHLSWMLRLMGHEIFCVPTSVVRHDYFLSMHPEKLRLLERNRLMLIATLWMPATRLRLLPMLVATELMLWGYALLRGPRFALAKARAYAPLLFEREALARRRDAVAGLRRVRDADVLRNLTWRYAWRQFATLAGERGQPRREIARAPRR